MRQLSEFQAWDLRAITRKRFVKNICFILILQISITALVAMLPYFWHNFAMFQESHTLLSWIIACFSFGALAVIINWKKIDQEYPTNILIVLLYTVSSSYIFSTVFAKYAIESLIMTCALTLVILAALVFISTLTRLDSTKIPSSFRARVLDIIWASLFLSFFNNSIFAIEFTPAAIAIFLFYCWYFIVDLQSMVGGRTKQLSIDHQIFGAVLLYVDGLGIFLKLLEIFGYKVSTNPVI